MHREWLAIPGRRLAVCDQLGSSMDQRANRNNTLPYLLTSLTSPYLKLHKGRKEGSKGKGATPVPLWTVLII
eukprot:12896655-Prorocentrum_lima.AAC.1